MPDTRTAPANLLLLEPQTLFRRTVVGVVNEMPRIDLLEASSTEAAQRALDRKKFDAIVVALDEEGTVVAMLRQVRSGAYRTDSNVPVVVLTELCDQARIAEMRSMNVRRILLKPFKVKGVLETISELCAA